MTHVESLRALNIVLSRIETRAKVLSTSPLIRTMQLLQEVGVDREGPADPRLESVLARLHALDEDIGALLVIHSGILDVPRELVHVEATTGAA